MGNFNIIVFRYDYNCLCIEWAKSKSPANKYRITQIPPDIQMRITRRFSRLMNWLNTQLAYLNMPHSHRVPSTHTKTRKLCRTWLTQFADDYGQRRVVVFVVVVIAKLFLPISRHTSRRSWPPTDKPKCATILIQAQRTCVLGLVMLACVCVCV